jgi:hypothetical protein
MDRCLSPNSARSACRACVESRLAPFPKSRQRVSANLVELDLSSRRKFPHARRNRHYSLGSPHVEIGCRQRVGWRRSRTIPRREERLSALNGFVAALRFNVDGETWLSVCYMRGPHWLLSRPSSLCSSLLPNCCPAMKWQLYPSAVGDGFEDDAVMRRPIGNDQSRSVYRSRRDLALSGCNTALS